MLSSPQMNLPTLAQLREWGHSCLDYTHEQLVGCTMMMMLEVILFLQSSSPISQENQVHCVVRKAGESHASSQRLLREKEGFIYF